MRPEGAAFGDRLLADAVDAFEQITQAELHDPQAEEKARLSGSDPEQQFVVRARSLDASQPLREALHHVGQSMSMFVLLGLVLALIAGAAAATAALGTPADNQQSVNFFWALAGLLGVQTILLLIWITCMIAAGRGGVGGAVMLPIAWLGMAVVRAAQFAGRVMHKGPFHLAATAAIANVYTRSPIGKWTLSSISHALWLAFNVGCLTLIIALLSARQYTFVWETTILSERTYVPLTEGLAWLPRLAGFPVPDEEQIRSSQRSTQQDNATRQAWSGLLVGSMVVYGFGPRVLLLGYCLGRRRMARSRYRLDLSLPGRMRLQTRLMPAAERLPVHVGPPENAGGLVAHEMAHSPPSRTRPIGPPAIVGIEIDRPSTAWPPPLNGTRWLDLGFVENRDDRRAVLRQLSASSHQPRALIVVCGLTTTPDRGIQGFLAELSEAASAPPVVLLTGGEKLRERMSSGGSGGGDEHILQRSADWRALVERVGQVGGVGSQAVELDLDHLTHATQAKLAALVGNDQPPSTTVGGCRIDAAFDLIVRAVQSWGQATLPPSPAQQAELHRSIAALYRDEHSSWGNLFGAPAGQMGHDLLSRVQSGSQRVRGLLPARLRRNPRWLAAGGLAGALGCVAAATLISPVAIAALPMWSAIGAAIAAFSGPSANSKQDSAKEQPDIGAAVRAAALFTMLLELQGREEAAITRILDRAIDPDNELDGNHAVIDGPDAARIWLRELSHRLDMAIAQESAA